MMEQIEQALGAAYHPDYGLDNGTRARVVWEVTCNSVMPGNSMAKAVAAASEKHGVGVSTIYRWIKDVRETVK